MNNRNIRILIQLDKKHNGFGAKIAALCLTLLVLLVPVACTEEESDLGLSLQDPFTLYEGVRDTASLSACTLLDDSLSTAGYTAGTFGDYHDPVFGDVEAIIYSQISTTKEGVRISEDVIFDSVVMTLAIDSVFPILPDSTPQPLHVIVKQLDEQVVSDSAYYSTDKLAESSVCFFDDVVTYIADSIRLVLNGNIESVLRKSCSQEDFIKQAKGFCLKLAPGSNKLLTVDFSALGTRLSFYYHTAEVPNLKYDFVINSEAAHCMYYGHNYANTSLAPFASNRKDSIEGSQKLYLEPLGGTKLRVNMQDFITRFSKEHPHAVIHYAELLLPVSDTAETQLPVRVLALKRNADGTSQYVTDANVLSNPYTYSGFDGYYHRDSHQYRLRITRHLQEMLRTGRDYGTELIIDARRSSALRAVINGSGTDNPIRVDFIYTE